jgi:hypothetical protein
MVSAMSIDSMHHPLAELQEASQLVSKFREGLEQVSLASVALMICAITEYIDDIVWIHKQYDGQSREPFGIGVVSCVSDTGERN